MFERDDRHACLAKLLGCLQPAVAANDGVLSVDYYRVDPAKLAQALRNLADLAVGVLARVTGIGGKRRGRST